MIMIIITSISKIHINIIFLHHKTFNTKTTTTKNKGDNSYVSFLSSPLLPSPLLLPFLSTPSFPLLATRASPNSAEEDNTGTPLHQLIM